ncbi:purine nucleoside phosphorylase deoD-type [Enterococcus phoeniculicola]|jgi:purine-nucleoside phosphorylase|uniref:Purine nucleoside phosphorylase DeoD-type n=1 Tax=Enterococcus phoeniculicola ATCC BAA-412 TaxID=1158610 RepID=R3WD02_9ENTE|nr:purine-nucleoside phosphorylase [Enterococcus phoeniculicola]EOL45347.1 purine nucleoside phosphorylase deoD-type [Enterococcus phoeniculicola ATCC BAA-412]EOT74709.1 purine nucleoside phosphorylase deoD-type [Enterococcus phoeniculicola ATCC BAA-412]OJG73855.1 purine nucleoside phosphorylase deoD-type [Enterococcus phoeniculicola]
MSVHIEAKQGEIADKILLPGDPLRAKYIAETFLEDAVCYNNVRGMLGYTGTYKGERISVQGTGMGMPSATIYAHELINEYGVKKLIRVGTCGALAKEIHVRDLIIAQGAATSSSMIEKNFQAFHFPPIGDFDLLLKAYEVAKEKGFTTHVGNVLSEDSFYKDDLTETMKLADLGVMGVEMEAAALYYLGAKFNVQTLAIMTVSDHLITGEETTAEERQTTFADMIHVGLEAAIR